MCSATSRSLYPNSHPTTIGSFLWFGLRTLICFPISWCMFEKAGNVCLLLHYENIGLELSRACSTPESSYLENTYSFSQSFPHFPLWAKTLLLSTHPPNYQIPWFLKFPNSSSDWPCKWFSNLLGTLSFPQYRSLKFLFYSLSDPPKQFNTKLVIYWSVLPLDPSCKICIL